MTDQYEALRADLQASIARLLASADPKYRDGFRAQALMIDARIELVRATINMLDAGLDLGPIAAAMGGAFGSAVLNLVNAASPDDEAAIVRAYFDAFARAVRPSAAHADVVSAEFSLSAGRA